MLKQLAPKLRYAVIGSFILNGLFILWLLIGAFATWYIESTGALDYAQITGFQNHFCGQYFQRMLDNIDKQYPGDPERAAAQKNSFAINICLKNYKTGERLDVRPLVDQVK